MVKEKEFSHIEVRVVRNPKWLKNKHPFYLSESFPLCNMKLPKRFENMTEDKLTDLKLWFVYHVTEFLKIEEEHHG